MEAGDLDKVFNLFQEGTYRGSSEKERQALLDAFTTRPNRYLTPGGEYTDEAFAIGGIDKFRSLLAVCGERLKADGNRIVPSAMIREGVYVGKRNIFMFHAAVNIAAYIGDDNLIDSHASIGSAAQVGNKNKIGSFVSLEGVLSPANAKPVIIGDENFLGSFVRIGTGIEIGNRNFFGSGVNLSLGTKIKDCRDSSPLKGSYVTPENLIGELNSLVVAPNNAARTFAGVALVPGEYILFENTEEFMSRFERDSRISGK